MARPLRIEYEGAFYHVTSRGNERKRIFSARTDYHQFKRYLKQAQEKYGYSLHGYVLMTNHYHLIIETPEGNLSKVMQYINGSYTNFFNRRTRRSGHLFQGRYKAILLLGGKSFIREALARLRRDSVCRRGEVSHRKALQRRYEAEEIVELVSEHFGIRVEALVGRKGDGRSLLTHLLKSQTAMTNKEIGEFVGSLGYSGVSRVEERFIEKLKKNRALGKGLKVVLDKMSKVNDPIHIYKKIWGLIFTESLRIHAIARLRISRSIDPKALPDSKTSWAIKAPVSPQSRFMNDLSIAIPPDDPCCGSFLLDSQREFL